MPAAFSLRSLRPSARPGDRRCRRRPGRGVSLIETVLASALVGGLAVAGLTAAGAAASRVALMSQRATARAIVDDVASEISSTSYEPGVSVASGLAGRLSLDDVDDYAGRVEQPPRTRAGALIVGAERMRLRVSVSPYDERTVSAGTDTGRKLVWVRVSTVGPMVGGGSEGRVLAESSLIVSRAWSGVKP